MKKEYFLRSDTHYLVGPFPDRIAALTWYDYASKLGYGEECQSTMLVNLIKASGDSDFMSSIEGSMEAGDFVPEVYCLLKEE